MSSNRSPDIQLSKEAIDELKRKPDGLYEDGTILNFKGQLYGIGKEIGKGAYGKVKHAINLETRKEHAVKIQITKKQVQAEIKLRAEKEAFLLSKLGRGEQDIFVSTTSSGNLQIINVMDFLQGEPLEQYLAKCPNKRVTPEEGKAF